MGVTAAGGNLASLALKLIRLTPEQVDQLVPPGLNYIEPLKEYLRVTSDVLLCPAAQKDCSPQLKLWKSKVREHAYCVEVAIDEYSVLTAPNSNASLEDVQRILSTIENRSQEIMELEHHFGVIGEIQRLKASIGDAPASTNNQEAPPAIRENGELYMDPTGLVGINRSTKVVIDLLEMDCRVVSIVGFGGLGKTTLAKDVFKKMATPTPDRQFDCTAFVTVSRKPIMKDVMNNILAALKSEDSSHVANPEPLISKHVQGKRYLVVLDDVWDKKDWIHINKVLRNDKPGSRVIVTTRNSEVAEESCPPGGYIHEMRKLCGEDAEELFLLKAFPRERECPPHLIESFGKILKRCDGSPLAILVLSGLVATKVTPEQWDQVAEYFGAVVPGDPEVVTMRDILSLGYSDLPHHLRTCLLYLSIFPEDHEISREVLVNRWIAEGFITEQDKQNKTAAGKRYFGELISRNLIQPVKIKYDRQVTICRVHDTILDFIIAKSVEDKFVTLGLGPEDADEEIRHLSIQNTEGIAELGVSGVSPLARSLTIFGSITIETPEISLQNTALRVLDLGQCYSENDEYYPFSDIEELFHIRYLDPGPIHDYYLPKDFGKLQQLETLELRYMNVDMGDVVTLPVSINQLQRLVRLRVNPGVLFPDQIEGMQSLENLKTVELNDCSEYFLKQLSMLTNLKVLGTCFDTSAVDVCLDSILDSLTMLGEEKLHSLYIEFTDNDNSVSLELPSPDNDDLWKLALQKVRKLRLNGQYIIVVPAWMSTFNRLHKLQISPEVMNQEQVDILGRMESLLDLMLGFRFSNGDLSFDGQNAFKHLKYFGIEIMPQLGWKLAVQIRSVSKLELFKLYLWTYSYSPENYAIDGFKFVIGDVPRLKTVDVCISCRDRTYTVVQVAKAVIKDAAMRLAHLPPTILKINTRTQIGESDYEEVVCDVIENMEIDP